MSLSSTPAPVSIVAAPWTKIMEADRRERHGQRDPLRLHCRPVLLAIRSAVQPSACRCRSFPYRSISSSQHCETYGGFGAVPPW